MTKLYTVESTTDNDLEAETLRHLTAWLRGDLDLFGDVAATIEQWRRALRVMVTDQTFTAEELEAQFEFEELTED